MAIEHRKLGSTGISVSPLCLGAMMFGAWGNTDHDDSIAHHPRARSTRASTSSTPPTSTRAASPRRSSARRSRAAGATRSCSRRRRTARCTTTIRTSSATRAAGSSGGREQPATAENRLDRPLPDPPSRAGHRHRRDARRAQRPRRRRQGPLRSAARRFPPGRSSGAVGRRAARPRALHLRAAALLDADPRDRGRRAARLRAVRDGRDPLEPARRRLAVGPLRARAASRRARAAARRCSPRATTCRSPATRPSSRPPRRSASSPRRPACR